jgi:hypothetical protein
MQGTVQIVSGVSPLTGLSSLSLKGCTQVRISAAFNQFACVAHRPCLTVTVHHCRTAVSIGGREGNDAWSESILDPAAIVDLLCSAFRSKMTPSAYSERCGASHT